MRYALALIPLIVSAESIDFGGHKWTVPYAKDWSIESGELRLLVSRPGLQPRRPTQFALAETAPFSRVSVEAELISHPRLPTTSPSLIIVYAYRDAGHYNYAHLSVDRAADQNVHNGIFHVYGGDRVRISPLEGPPTLSAGGIWHKVRLDYDSASGEVKVTVNGVTSPAMQAVDKSLGAGKIGLGSFFDTGAFRGVKITGTPAPATVSRADRESR